MVQKSAVAIHEKKVGSKFTKQRKSKLHHRDKPPEETETAEEAKDAPRKRSASYELRKDWYSVQPVKLPLFIRVLSKCSLLWEFFIYFLIINQYFWTTYGVFFTSYDSFLWTNLLILECIYAMDVIMRLGIEVWRYEYRCPILVFTLPYRYTHAIMDVISLFPLYSFISVCSGPLRDSFHYLSYLDFAKLIIYIRLFRAAKFFDILEVRRLVTEEALFLMRFTNIYLMFINCVSCLFFFLAQLTPVDFMLWRNLAVVDSSWAKYFTTKKPEYGIEPADLYTLSLHFATATVTTVGYGDLHGETEIEMMCCIVIMLFGAIFLNGYFTSQITNFLLELDGARFDLFYRLSGIRSHLSESGMSLFFQTKVELYYKCLWTYREGVDKVIFIDHLPRSLLEDVYFDICTEMFHKSYLFRELDEAFLRAVSKIVKIALYNPDMILCRYGGYANQMYYILQGECRAMSKHEASKRAAILRAGSIIGETNLFFSCPYTISVETNTCCQFISIDKEELMQVFNKFPTELTLLRFRSQQKTIQMYQHFQIFGEDPICWVQKREEYGDGIDIVDPGVDPSKKNKNVVTTVGRWGDGLNTKVTEDVIADADRFVIFETMCSNSASQKNHVTPYMTCVVPEILNSKLKIIIYWNRIIILFALIYSFIGPFCYSFGAASHLEQYICRASSMFEYVNEVMYIMDLIFEVVGACPVEGFYFRIQDGFQVKSRETMFYFDILAAIPMEFYPGKNQHDVAHLLNVILKSFKLRKVIRYLRYLDNVFPKDLFWFRLGQTFLVLMYGIHFIACFIFNQACPTLDHDHEHTADGMYVGSDEIECSSNGWIASYKTAADFNNQPLAPEYEPEELSKRNPYLISFYFATATLTSAGFGDFNPQNKDEIMYVICFQLIGFFLIGYYTSLLTSALACVVKPRLEFQQKLLAVKRFMEYYVLPEVLQRRVVEHYELQHQYCNGVNLPKNETHFLYDAPDYIKQDVLYSDVVLLLDGIPLFSKTESKYIIKMSELMKRYLLPPNIKFLHIGEVRKTMYAIRSGSIGVFDGRSEEPMSILESTAYFGLRDLLLGEPAHYDFITLSYCVVYEITHAHFMDIFEEDDELLDYIDSHHQEMKGEVEEMCRTYSTLERDRQTDQAVMIPSWIFYKPSKTNKLNQMKYYEYQHYFKDFRVGRLLRGFLMNGVVHPAGYFASLWTSFISFVAALSICTLLMETFMYYRQPSFRIFQWSLDAFFYVDIYIRLHWAYYLQDGLFVTHPLKTAALYVWEGSFIYDVVAVAHPEMMMFFFGYTNFFGYGEGATWYTKLRWTRIMHIRRVPQIFEIIHTIFVWRNAILFILYVCMTVIVCTTVAAVALAIGCPWTSNDWSEGDEYKLPYCLDGTWAMTKGDADFHGTGAVSLSNFLSRWVVGVYYVSGVILVVGFGDMITLNIPEVYLLIFMSIFGFIFMRCIVADITAAEVDSDQIRSSFIDHMKRLVQIMTREKISNRMITNVKEHLEHTWKQTKGLEPRELFADLHPALESDLYRTYVGDKLNKVPVFKDLQTNVLRSLCKFARKLFFLTGERLTRCGNLEYDMFIIITGKVWVTDRLLNYGCTLHKNESFGETGILSLLPRRFTVVAAENTEVFVISHNDFATILTRYPAVKDLLNSRTGHGHFDFFEHKIYDMIDWLKGLAGPDKDHRIDVLVARTQVIKHFVYAKEDPEEEDEAAKKMLLNKKKYQFFSYGSDDDNLPFIYLITQRSKKTGKFTLFPPLIHPNCILIRWYLKAIYLIFFFFPAITVYEVCFPKDPNIDNDTVTTVVKHLSSNMQYVMLLYVVLNFLMPYEDADGNFVKSSGSAAMNYVTKFPTGMILDLAAALPPLFSPPPKDQKDVKYYRLSAVLWLYRYYAHHLSKRDDLSISAFQFKITLSVSSFCLMAHVLACIFYSISYCQTNEIVDPDPNGDKFEYICPDNTWTSSFVAESFQDEPWEVINEMGKPWRWWVRALYWVVTVISTTGFGDITPHGVGEMTLGIICVFCGAFILSIILSHFTAGMASLTKAHREYMYQVKLLVKYLRNIGLSVLRQNQMYLYFEAVWNNCRGDLYHKALSILPATMQIDVAYALFYPVLKKVRLFHVAEKSFLRQVAARLTHSIYLPGICIVKEGDQGTLLYIVYKGRVSGLIEDLDDKCELKNVYLVGDVFGKFPALFVDEWYRKSYRAEEYTEILALSQHDILHLATIYEEFWKLLTVYIQRKYHPNGEADCIFAEGRAIYNDHKKDELYDINNAVNKENETKEKTPLHKKINKKIVHSERNTIRESVASDTPMTATPQIKTDTSAPPGGGATFAYGDIDLHELLPQSKNPLLLSPTAESSMDLIREELIPKVRQEEGETPQEKVVKKKGKISSIKKIPKGAASSKFTTVPSHWDSLRIHIPSQLRKKTPAGKKKSKAQNRKTVTLDVVADPITQLYIRDPVVDLEQSLQETKKKKKKTIAPIPSTTIVKKKIIPKPANKKITPGPSASKTKSKVVKKGPSKYKKKEF